MIIIKTLFKATLTITLFSIFTRAMGFANRIFLSHSIGAEGLGLYQVVCSIFGVLITFTSSGLPISVSKQTAKLRSVKNYDGGHSTVSAAVLIGSAIAAVITLGVVLFNDQFAKLFADERSMPIFMVLLPGVAASAIYSAYRGGLWGQKNFLAYSFCEFFEELILVLTGMILISRVSGIFNGAKNAAISVSIAYVAAALVSVILYFYYDGKIKSPKGYVRPLITSAAPITGIRLASSIITSILAIVLPKRLMLSGLTAPQALAEFGIASGMVLPLLFIPGTVVGSLALALIPEISSHKDKKSQEVSSLVQNAISFAIMIAFLVFIPFFSVGKDLATLMYKNERAGQLLVYSAIIMVPLCLSQISSSLLNSLGKEVSSLTNYVISALIMLACVWFLPPLIGIYSMLVGFACCFSVNSVMNTIEVFKNIKAVKGFGKTIFAQTIVCIMCCLLCYLVSSLLKTFLPNALSLIISIIVGMSGYLFSLAMLKINNLNTIFKKFMPKRFTETTK